MSLLNEAKLLKDTLVTHRRYFHQNAEIHLDLPLTSAYVAEKLKEMGYDPEIIGTSGVLAIAGGKKPGKTFLLRADMDALPMAEECDLEFRSETGNMHACGHDLHASMLLGAARLLKNHEDEIQGQVKLMFQPAEETLSGAKMMVDSGIMENPKVDCAMMIHVETGISLPTGGVVILNPASSYTACDWFAIKIRAKGCHGAMPELGVDPLNILSHIHIGLQAINARETAPAEFIALTIGQMHGGNASNVIPDSGYMTGTIRTINSKTREFAKKRLEEIAKGIAAAFRAAAEVEFERGCPPVMINEEVNSQIRGYCEDLLGKEQVFDIAERSPSNSSLGSEDFAFLSELAPSTCLSLVAGTADDGYIHAIHHPKVRFDEEALPIGAAVHANAAIRWLQDNQIQDG